MNLPIMPSRPEQNLKIVAIQNQINFLNELSSRPFSGNMNWRDKQNAIDSLAGLQKAYQIEMKKVQDNFNIQMKEYKKQLILFYENEKLEKEAQIKHEKQSCNPFYNLNIPRED